MGLFDIFKRKKNQMFLYSEADLDQYEKFIEENFGKFETVLHEIVSPDIHVDIIIVPPTPEHNFYKLITMGMGAYEMNIPRGLKQYELERAELVLYLPPTWDVNSSKEEDYWPIGYLKMLARMPLNYNTWLGVGHSIGSGAENEPFADNTEFCAIMLLKAWNLEMEELDLQLSDSGKINFYQFFPLYKEELEFKQENDAETLLELFDDEDVIPVLNNGRKNYCKKS